jgi:hypothetical protein
LLSQFLSSLSSFRPSFQMSTFCLTLTDMFFVFVFFFALG